MFFIIVAVSVEGPRAEAMFKEATEKGLWVFFQNCHLAPSWMPSLERLIETINPERVSIVICCIHHSFCHSLFYLIIIIIIYLSLSYLNYLSYLSSVYLAPSHWLSLEMHGELGSSLDVGWS